MEFTVEKLALEQDFLQAPWLSHENYYPWLLLNIHLVFVAGIVEPVGGTVSKGDYLSHWQDNKFPTSMELNILLVC